MTIKPLIDIVDEQKCENQDNKGDYQKADW